MKFKRYWIAVGLFILYLVVTQTYSVIKGKDLKARYKIARAYAYDYSGGYGVGHWLDYYYYVNGEKIESSNKKGLSMIEINNLINLHLAIPVVYDSLNPEVSDLLLREEDFKEYNVSYPDTMNSFFEKIDKPPYLYKRGR